MKKLKRFFLFSVIQITILFYCIPPLAGQLPESFVYIKDAIPDITVELKYYTDDNFVGKRIDGYLKPRCILTKQAASALKKVQDDLKAFGLGLKVFDAYRPQRAVGHFVR